MPVAAAPKEQTTADYFSTPSGSSHLNNIGIRLRDVAAVLAEHGLQDAAEHVSQAYGCILGHLAAQGQNAA